MKRTLRIGTILVFGVSAAAIAAFAQSVWTDKPFTQWSRSDAESVLNDSPWSSHQEVRMQFEKEKQTAAGSYSGVSAASAAGSQMEVTSDLPVDFVFTLRLRSALPVRQALVRLKQLEADSKNLKQRDAEPFDAQIKGLLECPACAGNYVVTLSSKSRNRPGADAVYGTFKGGRLSDLQRFVFIANDRGERRQLVHFVAPRAPGDDAIFFFPRLDEKGTPLLFPKSMALLINRSAKQHNSASTSKSTAYKFVLHGTMAL